MGIDIFIHTYLSSCRACSSSSFVSGPASAGVVVLPKVCGVRCVSFTNHMLQWSRIQFDSFHRVRLHCPEFKRKPVSISSHISAKLFQRSHIFPTVIFFYQRAPFSTGMVPVP